VVRAERRPPEHLAVPAEARDVAPGGPAVVAFGVAGGRLLLAPDDEQVAVRKQARVVPAEAGLERPRAHHLAVGIDELRRAQVRIGEQVVARVRARDVVHDDTGATVLHRVGGDVDVAESLQTLDLGARHRRRRREARRGRGRRGRRATIARRESAAEDEQ
jgi:hypothetical protein